MDAKMPVLSRIAEGNAMSVEMPEQQFCEKNAAGTGRPAARRVLFSANLFRGAREIIIEHGSQRYRLRITKAGKLILNK